MRKIREVLRLSQHEGLSLREVAASLQLPFTTVGDHVRRARAAGLSWPLPDDLDDDALEARLFASAAPPADRPLPDWQQLHRELRRPAVAEALPSQELMHWIAAHVHAFEALEGCPAIVVCDNLRSGVTRPHRYEPDVNATYSEMAAHYGVAVIPARSYKPRDKAKAENGVLLAERWIMARLRDRRFGSLGEANAEIRR